MLTEFTDLCLAGMGEYERLVQLQILATSLPATAGSGRFSWALTAGQAETSSRKYNNNKNNFDRVPTHFYILFKIELAKEGTSVYISCKNIE